MVGTMERAAPICSCGADRLDRRELLRRGAAVGFGLPLLGALGASCSDGGENAGARRLNAVCLEWVLRLYPQLAAIGSSPPALEIAGPTRFFFAAHNGVPAAEIYIGLTPFAELVPLVNQGLLAPWDGTMPGAVADDVPLPIRREATLNGRMYSWPFLLDVTILGWNSELLERAEIDPGTVPRTWDELIEASRMVVRRGAAPYGCTFDPRPWRSLVPVTYSFSTRVFDEHGRFDYVSDAAVAALETLRRMKELANPDLLEAGLSTGAGLTPDEGAFAAGLAAYYVKYQNAHIRNAATWPDPGQLVLARLPRPPGGAGKTVFWTTGIGLVRLGSDRPAAARYARSLTYADDFWEAALGGRGAAGQLPVFNSLWASWRDDPPPWLDWAANVKAQLGHAEAIPASRVGLSQFKRAQRELDRYLSGEEPNALRALKRADAATPRTR